MTGHLKGAVPPRLEQRVLVLNRLWQPVNIVGVLRAMSLLFRGRASAITSDSASGHRVLSAAEWLKFSAESPPPAGDAVELAAWTSLARVLLNSQEVITRY
jgi:hypothetical protein